jgi:hypothetical protein
VLGAAVLAIVLGVLVALPLGRDRELSVEVWLTAAALWFAVLTVQAIFRAAPVAGTGLRWIWSRTAAPEEPPVKLPRDLQALEGTVVGGRDSAKGFSQRLQPRLIAIVSHGLQTRHGIDMGQQPEQAAAVLGEDAWLVDPDVQDRAPDLAQIHRLLDRALPEGAP